MIIPTQMNLAPSTITRCLVVLLFRQAPFASATVSQFPQAAVATNTKRPAPVTNTKHLEGTIGIRTDQNHLNYSRSARLPLVGCAGTGFALIGSEPGPNQF